MALNYKWNLFHKSAKQLLENSSELKLIFLAQISSRNLSNSNHSCPMSSRNVQLEETMLLDKSNEKANTNSDEIKSMENLKGPPSLPLVGNFLTYLKKENQGRMHEVQTQYHTKYGSIFREKWGTSWQVHVSDPDLISEIYRKDGRYPHRPAIQAWVHYRRVSGNSQSLLTAQGDEWYRYRTEFGKRMLCPKTNRKFINVFNSVGDDLIRRLQYVRDNYGTKEFTKRLPNEMYKWSLEAGGAVLFETRLGCLKNSLPKRTQDFIDATQNMMTSSLYLIVGEKLHERFNTPFWKRHKTSWDKIFRIAKELVDERVSALKKEPKITLASSANDQKLEDENANKSTGLYLSYLLSDDDTDTNLSMNEISSNITDLLIGASDSTANTCCFALHLLANHKEALRKLNNEISEVTGESPVITNEMLDNMKYLKCVIKESLRLYPISTMNCRILDNDIVLKNHLIPKGTLILLNHYSASRDENNFTDANSFKPERWLRDQTNSSAHHHPFACLPFGFGQRACLGQRTGKMELMVTITKILQNFRLDVYPGVPFKPVLRTLLTPGDNVPIILEDRN